MYFTRYFLLLLTSLSLLRVCIIIVGVFVFVVWVQLLLMCVSLWQLQFVFFRLYVFTLDNWYLFLVYLLYHLIIIWNIFPLIESILLNILSMQHLSMQHCFHVVFCIIGTQYLHIRHPGKDKSFSTLNFYLAAQGGGGLNPLNPPP